MATLDIFSKKNIIILEVEPDFAQKIDFYIIFFEMDRRAYTLLNKINIKFLCLK